MTETKPKASGGDKKAASGKKKGKLASSVYTISGEKITRKNRSCPKCGPSIFMGVHANRVMCGKCRYVEFIKK
ncbi:TPA: 30S ribosomal protein S27ae [Candidatus Woesearchaeota archaeon]|nr:30S ribosomal protein S27ae [Candidatus Woesearchaeota archaeon]HIG93494.1 30S ribosomal protein S27ae [Candidatus Woesearchaeota archaeon]HIH13334.1 30S ribosomal protein S27ae [Candidatus Woesearchaeota archaeon]